MDRIDLEEELSKVLSQELTRAIDEEVMLAVEIEHLIIQGWHCVKIVPRNLPQYRDISIWVQENCGKHAHLGNTFVFREEKDAMWFKLNWA